MAVWVVTGKLGGGKTLGTLSRIQSYLNQGRAVATNIDVFPEKLINPDSKRAVLYRMPDKPTVADFNMLPLGYEGDYVGEHKNGLIALDECGTWFNSRDWNDPDRKGVIDWVIHARKRRWDIIFIIQDLSVMDKQAREMFAEHVVYCRRTDRFNIPIVGAFFKMAWGEKLPLPRYHIGFVHYGDRENSPCVDKWFYRGDAIQDAYNTEQAFAPFTPTNSACAFHQVLPPYYVYGRYHTPKERFRHAISNFKAKGVHFFLAGALLAALGTNAAVTAMPEVPKRGIFSCNDAYKHLYGSCDAYPIAKEQPEDATDADHATPAAGAVPAQESAPVGDPLDGVVISGSLQIDSSFEYVFSGGDGRTVYPRGLGYDVHAHGRCRAYLVSTVTGEQREIRCHPSDPDY